MVERAWVLFLRENQHQYRILRIGHLPYEYLPMYGLMERNENSAKEGDL
jgi:hypothetical protein